MWWKGLAAGTLTSLALLLGTGSASAGDVFRLNLNVDAPAWTLGGDVEADTVATRGYWRGYWRGYYPGFYYPRYYYPGVSFSFSYYRPWYVYRPFVYSYYWTPPVWYGSAYYYWPCSDSLAAMPSVTTLKGAVTPPVFSQRPLTEPAPATPQPAPQQGEGSYPYDGGPRSPVPMPKADPEPMAVPPSSVPMEGRAVSLPGRAAPKYTYPAYGELPRQPVFTEPPGMPVKGAPVRQVAR